MRWGGIILLLLMLPPPRAVCQQMQGLQPFPFNNGTWADRAKHRSWIRLLAREKKISAMRDPEKAVVAIQELLPHLPDKTLMQQKNAIFMGLQLSNLYIRLYRYDKAEAYLDSLTQVVTRIRPSSLRARFPNGNGTVYDVFETLGYLYLTTGSLKKAEETFTTSLALRKAIFPRHSVFRVPPVVGMGSLSYRRGDIEEAYKYFNQASKQMGRATTSFYDYDNIARLYLSDLSELCLSSGKFNRASYYINKLALASSGIAKFGSRIGSRLEIARIFELKARYYLLTGDLPKAQDYLERANQYLSGLTTSSDVTLKVLKTQALVYWQGGQQSKADTAMLQLMHAYQDKIDRNFIAMSDYEKEQFYNTLRSDLNLFNAITIRQSVDSAPSLYTSLLENTLNNKALLLNSSNKIRNSIVRSGNTSLIDQLHEWEKDKSLVSSYYFDKDAATRIDSLEARIEDLERSINAGSKLFASEEHRVRWREVQDQLKPGEAALEIIRINTLPAGFTNYYSVNNGLSDSVVYLAMVMKPGVRLPECFVMPNGNKMEHEGLAFYRNSLLTHSRDTLSYGIFWLPIRKHLEGVVRLFLSPDGVYNEINLNTLLDAKTNAYVLNEINIVNVTNTADLMRTHPPMDNEQPVVLVGRPAYNETLQTATAPADEYGTRSVLSDELNEVREENFADLAGTETEVRQIGRLLSGRGMKVETLLGADAEEQRIDEIEDPPALHIATHGFFIDDEASQVNPMIRSGLILAGVHSKDTGQGSDGILTAYEATNLALDSTNLVVLSACETGLGEVRNGEGVYGLQRAIMVAGARNLLMSLWKVDDAATAALMIAFYQNWDGQDNQEAFRKAQLAMQSKDPDPYYWGAFVMLGP